MTKADGHGEVCSFCGDSCSTIAATPGLWPLYFPDPQQYGTGKGSWHHTHCVMKKMMELEAVITVNKLLNEAIENYKKIT